jgi:hypothetical protein
VTMNLILKMKLKHQLFHRRHPTLYYRRHSNKT